MSADVTIRINGVACQVHEQQSVAAVLMSLRLPVRISVSGEPRTPFCGMGVCGECRVRVDGEAALACLVACREGMFVETAR